MGSFATFSTVCCHLSKQSFSSSVELPLKFWVPTENPLASHAYLLFGTGMSESKSFAIFNYLVNIFDMANHACFICRTSSRRSVSARQPYAWIMYNASWEFKPRRGSEQPWTRIRQSGDIHSLRIMGAKLHGGVGQCLLQVLNHGQRWLGCIGKQRDGKSWKTMMGRLYKKAHGRPGLTVRSNFFWWLGIQEAEPVGYSNHMKGAYSYIAMRPNKSNKVTSGMCWIHLAIGKYLSAAFSFDIIMGVSAMPTIWSGPQNWWTYLHADLITKATSNTVLPEEHMCWAMNCTSGSPFQSTLFVSQSALCVTAGQATHAHGLVRRRGKQRVVRGKVQQSKTRSHILGNGFFCCWRTWWIWFKDGAIWASWCPPASFKASIVSTSHLIPGFDQPACRLLLFNWICQVIVASIFSVCCESVVLAPPLGIFRWCCHQMYWREPPKTNHKWRSNQ